MLRVVVRVSEESGVGVGSRTQLFKALLGSWYLGLVRPWVDGGQLLFYFFVVPLASAGSKTEQHR